MIPNWSGTSGLQKRRPVFGAEDGVRGGDRGGCWGGCRGGNHDPGQLIHTYYKREFALSTGHASPGMARFGQDDGFACLRLR